MKILLLLSSFFIFSSPAQAIRPVGMYHPKNIALNLKKNKNHECDDRLKISSNDLSAYSFSSSIECKYQCKNDQRVQTVEISRYFDPQEQGLKPGDGYVTDSRILLSSFSTVFFNWTTKACIEEAIQKCGSIEKINTADFNKVTSGNWSLTEKPSCKNDRVIYSPYDEQYKLNTSKESKKTEIKSVLTIPQAEESKFCRFPIKGKVCFGDCILFDENNENIKRKRPLILMDKESPGNSDYEVCGDSLLKSFKSQSMSASVADSICQNFYTNSLVKMKAEGTTCAAFRGQANCSSFIKKMSK